MAENAPELDESTVHISETAAQAVPEVTAPPPAPEPVETATEPSFSFRDFAKQGGYNVDQFQTDEDAAKAFFNYVGSLQQPPPPPPAPKEPPKPAEEEWTPESHFSKFWEVPQFKPEWDDILVMNPQTGQIEAKPHVPWGTAQTALNEYTTWQTARAKAMKSLFESGNPYQKMYEAISPAMERQFAKREQITQEFSQRETENVIAAFDMQHSEWLATDDGQRFVDGFDSLRKQGMHEIEAIKFLSQYVKPVPNGQPAQTPEPTEAPAPPKPETSFTDDALAKAGHSRSGGASSTPSASQGALGAEEVRTMFKRAHAASRTAR